MHLPPEDKITSGALVKREDSEIDSCHSDSEIDTVGGKSNRYNTTEDVPDRFRTTDDVSNDALYKSFIML